jgi:hypothetical protein
VCSTINLTNMKRNMFNLIFALAFFVFACDKNNVLPAPGIDRHDESNAVGSSAVALITCAPATFYQVATTYNTYFTRNSGWTGGDATYSVPLGGGKTLWSFGDTFAGNAYPPDANHPYRWRDPQGMVPNTFMIQNGSSFITVVGTGGIDPVTWLYKPVVKTGKEHLTDIGREWYWPGDATVKNGTLYMLFHRYYKFGTGAWDYYTTGTDLATFSVAALSGLTAAVSEIAPTSVTPYYTVSAPSATQETLFGSALLEEGTTDYYMYISDKVSGFHFSKVLKVSQGDINGTRSYFNGYDASGAPTWTSTFPAPGVNQGLMKKKDANGVLSDLSVSPQFSVIKKGSKYRLITQEDIGGKKIFSYESSSPVGPWECESVIYTIPEPDTMPAVTYNAFIHPQITNGTNRYLISYNLNAQNWADLYSRVDLYRPKFIWTTVP